MRVRDLMNTDVVSVRADDRLTTALQSMLWAGVRHLPVVRDRQVVGILSERDLLRHRATVGDWSALDQVVEAAMSSPPELAGPEDDLGAASGRMAELKLGCLPVVEHGRLVGILTATDILAHQGRQAFGTLEPARGPTVAEVMSADPVTIAAADYVVDAAERLSILGVRHLPVIDDDRRVVGILSDRDVRLALGGRAWDPIAESEGPDFQQLRVGDVMTTEPLTLSPEVPLLTAVSYFIDWRIGAIPIVDREDRLLGIVSYVDALRSLRSGQRAAALRASEPDQNLD